MKNKKIIKSTGKGAGKGERMGRYNFDEIIDRCGTGSSKWDDFENRFPGYDVAGALPMWVADMDFRVPSEISSVIKKKAAEEIYGYPAPPGEDFYEAVVGWLDRHLGWSIEGNWIVTVGGVVPAVTYAVQEFTEEGDGVLIQPPVYYPFRQHCIGNNRRVAVTSPLIEKDGHYEIDFDDFRAKASRNDVKLFIFCNPHNPVGRVWSEEDIKILTRICEENNVLIVSDEIHSDLIMPGNKHTATGKVSQKNLISCYAPSKTFNLAGLQASTIVIPDDEIRRRYKDRLRRNEVGALNFFGAAAVKASYCYGDEWVKEVTEYISQNLKYAYSRLDEIRDLRYSITEGTYFLWIDFRGTGLDSRDVNKRILERAKVAGDLGEWFGEEGRGFLRLNLACPRATVKEALDRLERVFG